MLSKLHDNFYAKYILAIVAIVGGYLVLIMIDGYSDHQHTTLCLFKLTTGFPCPGCGMGRATLEILKGDVLSSFRYHILCIPFTLAIIISLIWMFADIIRRKATFFDFINQNMRTSFKIFLFAVLMVSWAINIVRQI